MAYTPNTLTVQGDGFLENTQSEWLYLSTDALATLTGAFYFSDCDKRGMKVGDLVDVIASTGPKYTRFQVTTVTSGSGATIAAPAAIT